ncbi:hypothetical protein CAEBREN_10619 [Caenorhabditis brenneri]|uniref:Uncharacterized protein n=1 Tax=Caenorhabditis brenneri TaxID=135651 RepID=G0MI90_CAEBE|nr:hypothetical protein CAEBREN_10619 [Caenorhabditis brenneri]
MILCFFLAFLTTVPSVTSIQCHSCLTYCNTVNGKVDPINCDCTSPPNEQCTGNACFAKVEIFGSEHTAVVQKGCISDFPAGQRGCQYSNNKDTINCFCDQDECNTRHKLGSYIPSRLPSVDCCICNSHDGEDCESGCSRKCRGNYCVTDFEGKDLGCGLGYPKLPSFLRVDDYLDYEGDYMCTRYESSASHVMNGCVCTHPSGLCNEFNKTFNYQKKHVMERKNENLHYCYALTHRAYKPFGQEVFKKYATMSEREEHNIFFRSSTCDGHFCFISLTTSEIIVESADFRHNYEDHNEFVGAARPRFELQVGCLRVNGDDKVQTGCTVETQGNNSEVLAKHCICDSHLCNFHHLVRGTEDPRPKAAVPGVKQTTSQLNPVRLYTSNKEIDENDILSVMNGGEIIWSAVSGVVALVFMLL